MPTITIKQSHSQYKRKSPKRKKSKSPKRKKSKSPKRKKSKSPKRKCSRTDKTYLKMSESQRQHHYNKSSCREKCCVEWADAPWERPQCMSQCL